MAPSHRPSSSSSSSSKAQHIPTTTTTSSSSMRSHPRTPTGSPRSSRSRSLSTETDYAGLGSIGAGLTPSSTRTRTTSGSITPKASQQQHQQRRLSSATTPSKPAEYRYSIGPSPVRFPRASSSAANGSQQDGKDGNLQPSASSSSLLPPSREASPAPTRSKRYHVASPSPSSSARATSPLPPHSSAALQSAMARDDTLPSASAFSSTLSPAPPRRPGASPAQDQTEERRPSTSSRSLKLTTFPFPHPTTPKGSTLDARYRGEQEGEAGGAFAKMMGGVARTLAGVMPSKWYESEPQDADTTPPPAARQSNATLPSHQPLVSERRQQDYGTITSQRHPSSRPVSYHARIVSDGDPDPSDPYGYRRLAGPELLPTYHAEHLEPRRKAAARRRRRGLGIGRFCGLEGAREDDDEETIRERRRRAMVAASIVGVALALCLVASWWGFFRLGLEEGEEEP